MIGKMKLIETLFFPGNSARQFFSAKLRPDVLLLFDAKDDQEMKDIEFLLQNCSIVCRIANCTRKVDVAKLTKFCKTAYLHFVKAFPWANLTQTYHRSFGHLIELIELNNGYGLGKWSETCLESAHKILRYLSVHLSRRDSDYHNMEDTFHHMWIMNDPDIKRYSATEEEKIQSYEKVSSADDVIFQSLLDEIEE